MATAEGSGGVVAPEAWRLKPSGGGIFGITAALVLVAVGLLCLLFAVRQPLQPFALLVLAAGALILAAGGVTLALALRYYRLWVWLGPDRLVVGTGAGSETMPLDQIEGVFSGQQIGRLPQVQGPNWPGLRLGPVRMPDHRPTWAICTGGDPADLSVIESPAKRLILTLDDPAAFRRALIENIEAGHGANEDAGAPPKVTRMVSPLHSALLVLGFGLLLAASVNAAGLYRTLPEMVVLQADAGARTAALSPRVEVFNLPAVGSIILVVNVALSLALGRTEPGAATLLLGSACLVEAGVAVAGMRLLG